MLADTMRELISYAVGCMFGRYALEKPGLILANQGETLADFVRKVAGAKGGNNESKELQGSDHLAEGHGFSGSGVSGNQDLSEGRAVRSDESGSTSGCLGSVEHCGRAGTAIDGRIQKLSVNSAGFISRSGNSIDDSLSTGLSDSISIGSNHGGTPGNQQNDSSLDGKTSHRPLTTSIGPCHFLPDDDNVIPILDGAWFTDDIVERFRKFISVTFGDDHYEENIEFIESGLNVKNKRNYTLRDYFLKEFFNDHVKRYKKRPIYWLFSSSKGSFNALIYMHRYRPDTVSVVLNDYLREFRNKLTSHKKYLEAVSINASASQNEKTQALKEIEKFKKKITELEEYERDVLYPLATEQVKIDLDDGVKINYPKFGNALKKIPGLKAKKS